MAQLTEFDQPNNAGDSAVIDAEYQRVETQDPNGDPEDPEDPEGDDGTDPEEPEHQAGPTRQGHRGKKKKGKPPQKGKPNAPQQPDGWEQIQRIALTDPDWSAHMAYLYRWEPKTDLTKGGTQPKYVCLFSQPFTAETIKQEHGSGVYNVKVNRINPTTKTSTTVIPIVFEILDPNFPPNVPEEAWVNHPGNKKWMWAKGKTPRTAAAPVGDTSAAAPAAAAAAGDGSTLDTLKFVVDTIMRSQPKQQQGGSNDAVMAELIKQVPQLLQHQKGMGIPELIALVTPFIPLITLLLSPKQNPLDSFLLQQLTDANNRAAKLEERMFELRKEADKPPPPPPSLVEQAKSFGDAITSLSAVTGLGARKGNDWLEFGADVIGRIAESPALAAMAQGFMMRPAAPPQQPPQHRPPGSAPPAAMNLAPLPAAAAPPAPPAGTPGGVPGGVPPGTPLAAASGTPTAPETPPPATGGTMFNPMQDFLDRVKPALLKHLNDGMTGTDFAFWLYDGYGAIKLKMLLAIGPDGILDMVKVHAPDLAEQLAPNWDQFVSFVQELSQWTVTTPRPGSEPPPDEEPPPAPPAPEPAAAKTRGRKEAK